MWDFSVLYDSSRLKFEARIKIVLEGIFQWQTMGLYMGETPMKEIYSTLQSQSLCPY